MESWKEKYVVSHGISTATVLNFEPARDLPPPRTPFSSRRKEEGRRELSQERKKETKKRSFSWSSPSPLLSLGAAGGKGWLIDGGWAVSEEERGEGASQRKGGGGGVVSGMERGNLFLLLFFRS